MRLERIPGKVKSRDSRKRRWRRSLTIPKPGNKHSLYQTERASAKLPCDGVVAHALRREARCLESTLTRTKFIKDLRVNFSSNFLTKKGYYPSNSKLSEEPMGLTVLKAFKYKHDGGCHATDQKT